MCISSCFCVCIFCVPPAATVEPADTSGAAQYSRGPTQRQQTNTKADNQSTAAMTIVVFLSLGPEDKQTSKSLCKKGVCAQQPPPPSPACSPAAGAERPRAEPRANEIISTNNSRIKVIVKVILIIIIIIISSPPQDVFFSFGSSISFFFFFQFSVVYKKWKKLTDQFCSVSNP